MINICNHFIKGNEDKSPIHKKILFNCWVRVLRNIKRESLIRSPVYSFFFSGLFGKCITILKKGFQFKRIQSGFSLHFVFNVLPFTETRIVAVVERSALYSSAFSRFILKTKVRVVMLKLETRRPSFLRLKFVMIFRAASLKQLWFTGSNVHYVLLCR